MHSWLNRIHTHNIYYVYVYPIAKNIFMCVYVCMSSRYWLASSKSIFLVLQIFTTIFLPSLLVSSFKTWGSYSWSAWVPIPKIRWIKIPVMVPLGYTNECLTQFCIVTQEVFCMPVFKSRVTGSHVGSWGRLSTKRKAEESPFLNYPYL